MSSPSHPSSDWTGDVLECPLTRYSREFRTLVDTETRRVAELLGLPISRVCELCGRDGVIAIGKKIAEIGNVYLNCRYCRKVKRLHELAMPPEVVATIEQARSREVERWLSEEGPETYMSSLAAAAGMTTPSSTTANTGSDVPPSIERPSKQLFTPVPCTPPPSTQPRGRLPSFEQKLFEALNISPPTTPERLLPSPLPDSSIPGSAASAALDAADSDVEVVGPLRRGQGTKRCPILLSPFSSTTKAEGSSSSGKRKATDSGNLPNKKAKVNSTGALRILNVLVWFKDGVKHISSEEHVPLVFSISDFATICAALNICPKDRFEVYWPNLCSWGDEISRDVPIAHYPLEYNTIMLRRSGVKSCPGFHTIVGKVFQD